MNFDSFAPLANSCRHWKKRKPKISTRKFEADDTTTLLIMGEIM